MIALSACNRDIGWASNDPRPHPDVLPQGALGTASMAAQPQGRGTGADSAMCGGADAANRTASRGDAPAAGTSKTFAVSGQVSLPLRSRGDVLKALRLAASARQEQAHAMNEQSSRSHCVVMATLRQSDGSATSFAFVDLAGSERLKKSGSEGQRRREAATVNNSLTTLGRCVRCLALATSTGTGGKREQPGAEFLPTRDSALTMLLSKV